MKYERGVPKCSTITVIYIYGRAVNFSRAFLPSAPAHRWPWHMNQHTITQKTQTYVTTLQPGAAAEAAEGKSCHLPVNDSHFIPTARPSVDVRNGAGGQRAAGETRPETPAGRKGRCMWATSPLYSTDRCNRELRIMEVKASEDNQSWISINPLNFKINPENWAYKSFICHLLSYSVQKMSENCEKCRSDDKSNVLFCPQYKDVHFTVTEEERNQKRFTFKKLFYSNQE